MHIQVEVVSDTEQQLSFQLNFLENGHSFVTTVVYAKCDALERLSLWEDIYSLSMNMNLPWLIEGNFNIILSGEEKIEGLSVYPQEYEDFAFCVNSCEFIDINFKGSPFIWWNGRTDSECIFKRLDRLLVNNSFLGTFCLVESVHPTRTGSDHAPLVLTCGSQSNSMRKPFKFLKFWSGYQERTVISLSI